MNENQPAMTFNKVSFAYERERVIDEATFAIAHRDFVGVIGPNGGGKTTLVKLMLGILRPREGSIDILGHAPHRACKRIGYMPQHSNLDPEFPVSVLDVVLMGRLGNVSGFGPYKPRDKNAALAALDEVGLADQAGRPLRQLSGGQKQRVLIARALAGEPLILDEPTANLDPAVQDDLYDQLRELNKRITIVVVSHDVGFVSLYFRTVICVNRSVHTHSTGELTNQQVADMYGREVRLVHSQSPHKGDCCD
ncbi:MAG: metal ABC transporter ATP-binding protein [Planctomycetes bacterium]|nr:metal ABC transporter ATP-binding protein [Planctomycetota bacterium]